MFPAHLFNKLLRVKHLVADSSAFHNFYRQNQILRCPNLLRSCENQIFASFCSLVNIGSSEVSLRTSKRRNRSDDKLDERKSYTVSYLINSCGLSPERAASVSSKLILKDSENADSVLALLHNHGLSKTQIANVVRIRPQIIVTKEKTLLPKLQFFQSTGISKTFLATFITRQPSWLIRSLDNFIIPNFDFLKSILLTDEKVVITCCRSQWYTLEDVGKNIVPNVKVLRKRKVPETSIKLLLTHFPEALTQKTDEFRESVSSVLKMGFNPLKSAFVLGLHAVSGNSNKAIWTRCFETYRNLGWSKQDIHMAFRKYPSCMIMSQNKILRTMDFLVNKIGVNSREIVESPRVLCYSLEKRTIPRCSVYQVLLSKGLIVKQLKLATFLVPSEKYFLEKFVVRYEEKVPKLYDYYKGKIGVEEL